MVWMDVNGVLATKSVAGAVVEGPNVSIAADSGILDCDDERIAVGEDCVQVLSDFICGRWRLFEIGDGIAHVVAPDGGNLLDVVWDCVSNFDDVFIHAVRQLSAL